MEIPHAHTIDPWRDHEEDDHGDDITHENNADEGITNNLVVNVVSVQQDIESKKRGDGKYLHPDRNP